HLGARRMMLAQRLDGFTNFTLARQKDQYIARPVAGALIHAIDHGINKVALFIRRLAAATQLITLIWIVLLHGLVQDVDGIQAAGHFDNRGRLVMLGEMLCKTVSIYRGRRNDEL